jgi:hypothetical protein
MKLKARKTPFASEVGEKSFLAFLDDGPLARIFEEEKLRLAPAKGSRRFRDDSENYPNLYEQTYFAHALNVSTTAGILFEAAARSATGDAPTDREIRIVLAAGVIHDFDKLPLSGGRPLARGLEEARNEAESLIAGFIDKADIETVLHLALDTESTTSREASSYEITINPRRATLAALCLQLADQLAGSDTDPENPEAYVAKIKRFREKHSGFHELPDIHVQLFALVPQPVLAREARNAFIDWIREHGTLLHESERYVTWIGSVPSLQDTQRIDASLWNRIKPKEEDAFEKAGCSHNSFGTTWTQFVDPTPQVVDRWIEYFRGRLVFWQGDWGVRNFEALSREFPGVFVFDKPSTDRPEGRVRLTVPESDEAAGVDYQRRRATAKLITAHCVMQVLLDTSARGLPEGDHGPFETDALEGVMGTTVPGILWAYAERENPEEAYGRVVERIAQRLREISPPRTNPVAGFMDTLLGKGPLPAAGPTGAGCVYCGKASSTTVEKAVMFGIKPTAWAPRKKGVQQESHRGFICDLCVVENQLRETAARISQARAGKDGFLTAHIHAADLVCDVYWDGLTPLLKSESADREERVLRLFPKSSRHEKAGGQVVPLRGHYSVPIPKPAASGNVGETLAYLYRLRDCLVFIRNTGFKLHVSPLALVPMQQRAQFRWENPPAWMEAAGLAEIHVDDLLPDLAEDGIHRPSALEVVEALIQAGKEVGRTQGHRVLISRILQNPLSLYEAAGRRVFSQTDGPHFVEILEEKYMDKDEKKSLEKIALAYIHFNARGEWSNNTWTWATRQYLDLRDGYRGEPEWKALVTGDLFSYAQRQNRGATAEQVENFVDAMEEYLVRFRGGQPPIGSDRRVLINAIAYQCRKLYRTVFPKEVPT